MDCEFFRVARPLTNDARICETRRDGVATPCVIGRATRCIPSLCLPFSRRCMLYSAIYHIPRAETTGFPPLQRFRYAEFTPTRTSHRDDSSDEKRERESPESDSNSPQVRSVSSELSLRGISDDDFTEC